MRQDEYFEIFYRKVWNEYLGKPMTAKSVKEFAKTFFDSGIQYDFVNEEINFFNDLDCTECDTRFQTLENTTICLNCTNKK